MEILQLAIWLAGAAVVVGLMQWVKGLVPKAPTWVWALCMPLISIGVGFSMKGATPVFDGLGVWAISQLGYDAILKRVIATIAAKKAAMPSQDKSVSDSLNP